MVFRVLLRAKSIADHDKHTLSATAKGDSHGVSFCAPSGLPKCLAMGSIEPLAWDVRVRGNRISFFEQAVHGSSAGVPHDFVGASDGPEGKTEVTPAEEPNRRIVFWTHSTIGVAPRCRLGCTGVFSLTQAARARALRLNSLRLSKATPWATYHNALASLRMIATIALPLRPPSRWILR